MPRFPIDYSKTIIYVIKCKDDNITEEYIGSTINFIERKSKHKTSCNNKTNKEHNTFKYKFIRDNGGWNNWIMLEVEKYPCNDKREAEKREEEIRVERKAKLNSIKAFGAETIKEYQKQYREEHKEELKELNKKYRELNKEYINNYDKQRYKIRKNECIEYQKKYREDHKEQIKEKIKTYDEKRRNIEYKCECGWIGNMDLKSKHIRKSKQHQEYIGEIKREISNLEEVE